MASPIQLVATAPGNAKFPGNATVVDRQRVGAGLLILRVHPDGGPIGFQPGQYTTLGCPPEILTHWAGESPLIKKGLRRSYSLSAPLVTPTGELAHPERYENWEFFIRVLEPDLEGRPRLTPWLNRLEVGDRLLAGPKVAGRYTLEGVAPGDRVALISTGTGEAPHNAMVAALLASGHHGPIGLVSCVRYPQDLAYATQHRWLERLHANYRYVTATTRVGPGFAEATSEPNFAGRYLQELFVDGSLEATLGWGLDPARTHVFLCGNPAMIGEIPPTPEVAAIGEMIEGRGPRSAGLASLLLARGFRLNRPRQPGNLHVEAYW